MGSPLETEGVSLALMQVYSDVCTRVALGVCISST